MNLGTRALPDFMEAEADAEEVHADLVAADLLPEGTDPAGRGQWSYWDLWYEWPDNLAMA